MFGSVEAISVVNNSKATGAWLTLSTRWEKLDHNNKFVKWYEKSLSNINNWLHRNIFQSPSSEQKMHWRHQLNLCLIAHKHNSRQKKKDFIHTKETKTWHKHLSINKFLLRICRNYKIELKTSIQILVHLCFKNQH